MPRVFISYSHDSEPHREAVLVLAQQLRTCGIDVHVDRFVPAPVDGWPRWMMTQVESADFVLLICTATYRKRFEGKEAVSMGRGATFEGLLATQYLYDDNACNRRFIPVIFEGTPEADIPTVLRAYQRYTLPLDADAHPEKLEPLVRHLTDQPEIVAAPLGPLKVLPPRAARTPYASATPPVAPATRTALASGTILSAGGADVQIEPIELLHRLLVSLFPTGDDFRRWVYFGPDGSSLVTEFPGGTTSAAASISGGLEILRSRGYIDVEFFTRLRSSYGRRRDDIERAAAAWGTPLSPMAAIPSTPAPAAGPAPGPAVTTTHSGLHFANSGNVTTMTDSKTIATPPMLKCLNRLFVRLFPDGDEMRRWIVMFDARLGADVPNGKSFAEQLHHTALALAHGGHISDRLLQELKRFRPRQQDIIEDSRPILISPIEDFFLGEMRSGTAQWVLGTMGFRPKVHRVEKVAYHSGEVLRGYLRLRYPAAIMVLHKSPDEDVWIRTFPYDDTAVSDGRALLSAGPYHIVVEGDTTPPHGTKCLTILCSPDYRTLAPLQGYCPPLQPMSIRSAEGASFARSVQRMVVDAHLRAEDYSYEVIPS